MQAVPSSIKPDPEAQLLSSLPRSFAYKKHLVLLDMATGCVHIIVDFFYHFTIENVGPSSYRRENYPFETYFKCGRPFEVKDPFRCNFVKGSHRPTPGNAPESSETTEDVESFSMAAKISICLVVLVLVGLLYAIMAKNKSKGTKVMSAVKSTTSLSATSKRASKSTVGKSSISGHGTKSKSTLKPSKSRTGSKTSISK